MKKMGLYCKAYLLGSLRAYPAWSEKVENARRSDDGGNDLPHPRVLSDDSIVYLQENFVVTDDVFKEENVLYDNVTPEWINYCQMALGFAVPNDVAAITNATQKKQT